MDEEMPPGVTWRKARRSAHNGGCLEVAFGPGGVVVNGHVHVRNSTEPTKSPLRLTPNEWMHFLDGARNGEFDIV